MHVLMTQTTIDPMHCQTSSQLPLSACTRRELGDIKYVFNFDFTGTYFNSYVGKFLAFFHTRQFTHAWLQQGFPLPLHHARLPMVLVLRHSIYTLVRQAVKMYTTGQFSGLESPDQLWLTHQRTTPPSPHCSGSELNLVVAKESNTN